MQGEGFEGTHQAHRPCLSLAVPHHSAGCLPYVRMSVFVVGRRGPERTLDTSARAWAGARHRCAVFAKCDNVNCRAVAMSFS